MYVCVSERERDTEEERSGSLIKKKILANLNISTKPNDRFLLTWNESIIESRMVITWETLFTNQIFCLGNQMNLYKHQHVHVHTHIYSTDTNVSVHACTRMWLFLTTRHCLDWINGTMKAESGPAIWFRVSYCPVTTLHNFVPWRQGQERAKGISSNVDSNVSKPMCVTTPVLCMTPP